MEKKQDVLAATDLEDVGKESRADPLAGEVVEASEAGEGTDQGSVGRRPHSPHLEETTGARDSAGVEQVNR